MHADASSVGSMKAFDKIQGMLSNSLAATATRVEEAKKGLIGSAGLHLAEEPFNILKGFAMLDAALLRAPQLAVHLTGTETMAVNQLPHVRFEAMNKLGAELDWRAVSRDASGPDAATNAITGFQDDDAKTMGSQLARGCEPGDSGAEDEDVSWFLHTSVCK